MQLQSVLHLAGTVFSPEEIIYYLQLINGDIGAGQDGAQEELFCRVCDPVDEDIEEGAEEEEAEVQRPLRDPGMYKEGSP